MKFVERKKSSTSYNKYRAQRTNGFDSKKEAKRAFDLQILAKAGLIQNLQKQVPFELFCSYTYNNRAVRPIVYIADFVYIDKHGVCIVEDVKGFKTPEYKLKKKLLLHPNLRNEIAKQLKIFGFFCDDFEFLES